VWWYRIALLNLTTRYPVPVPVQQFSQMTDSTGTSTADWYYINIGMLVLSKAAIYATVPYCITLLITWLWIRIDLIRIRIQHFCSIRIRIQNRIRIQAKTELSKKISFSNFFEIKIWVSNSSKFFFKKWLVLFYSFSVVKFFKKITKKCIFSIEIS
jgi:hypothetical protein